MVMEPLCCLQDVIRCDICETPVPLMNCDICQINLCKTCVGEHLYDESKEHKIVSFKMRGSTIMCRKHSAKICELYCRNCNIPICILCVSSEEHELHKKEEITKAFCCEEPLKGEIQETENPISLDFQEAASNIQTQGTEVGNHYQKSQNVFEETKTDFEIKSRNIISKEGLMARGSPRLPEMTASSQNTQDMKQHEQLSGFTPENIRKSRLAISHEEIDFLELESVKIEGEGSNLFAKSRHFSSNSLDHDEEYSSQSISNSSIEALRKIDEELRTLIEKEERKQQNERLKIDNQPMEQWRREGYNEKIKSNKNLIDISTKLERSNLNISFPRPLEMQHHYMRSSSTPKNLEFGSKTLHLPGNTCRKQMPSQPEEKLRGKRRHTVGGTDQLEHFKALMTVVNPRGSGSQRVSAWDQLQPDVKDIPLGPNSSMLSWLQYERLRGSSPNLSTEQNPKPTFNL